MAQEAFQYVPKQYQTLLESSLKNVGSSGLNSHEFETALEGIRREHSPIDYNPAVTLLSSIAEGRFPFVILVGASELKSNPVNYVHSKVNLDIPDKISLIPDPLQIPLIRNGQEESKPLSGFTQLGTKNLLRHILMPAVHSYIKEYLMRQPSDPNFEPRTVAIARAIHPSLDTKGGPALTIGYPYAEELRQIEMGMVRGPRQ